MGYCHGEHIYIISYIIFYHTLDVKIFDPKEITIINVTEYDIIVFGTGIHARKPYNSLVKYINKSNVPLVQKKLFLFIECMYNDKKGDRQRDAVAEQLGI